MLFRKGTIEKALKPSQRKSITEFATHFGTELSYEEKMRNKKIAQAILITAGVLALIGVGFFVTDVLLRITEVPFNP